MTTPTEVLSDDSSFYGDEEEKTTLEHEALAYDPESYWSTTHPRLLSTIQYQQLKQERDQKMDPTPMDIDSDVPKPLPRNKPGQHESSADFLKRLPPSTTKTESIGAWIYIHTTFISRLEYDEGEFTRKGKQLLDAYERTESDLRHENERNKGSAIALSRKLKPLQRELQNKIFELARETNCVSGKWMFFITADRVDSYWSAIADATMNGHLGIAAKVATDDGEDRARLIAVYTRDYQDTDDVKRVLRKLVELNLVKKSEKPVYYKADALTYLNIMSKNNYGMRATLYSSADVLTGKI
ncbi:hypothetical protein BJY04DRAFT_219955 [Aspergillus karnatakaensis]|uniref:DUF1917 domain-containing protein n=1 Tax=Aspergillus karnatakaensis TaxID=1810916 RepID=UPI003CCE2400